MGLGYAAGHNDLTLGAVWDSNPLAHRKVRISISISLSNKWAAAVTGGLLAGLFVSDAIQLSSLPPPLEYIASN